MRFSLSRRSPSRTAIYRPTIRARTTHRRQRRPEARVIRDGSRADSLERHARCEAPAALVVGSAADQVGFHEDAGADRDTDAGCGASFLSTHLIESAAATNP